MGVLAGGSVGAAVGKTTVGRIAAVGGISRGRGVGLDGGGAGLSTKTDGSVGVGRGPGWHALSSVRPTRLASPISPLKWNRPHGLRAVSVRQKTMARTG